MALRPGDAVAVRFTKWGGGGVPTTSVYVDVTTQAVWDGPLVTMVDLDLDVIRSRDGDLLLDDEDEFDEHRVTLGYPADVVALARRTAEELMTAAAAGHEPFGPTGSRWLARLAASTP